MPLLSGTIAPNELAGIDNMDAKSKPILHNLLLIGAVVGALVGILAGVIIGIGRETLLGSTTSGLFYGLLAGITLGSLTHAYRIKKQDPQ